MFKGYIIKLGLFIVLTILISGCSSSENLGDLAATSNIINTDYGEAEVKNNKVKERAEVKVKEKNPSVIIEDTTKNEPTKVPKKRGFFAQLFGKYLSNPEKENTSENISKTPDNIENKSKIVDKSYEKPSTVNEDSTEPLGKRREGIFRRTWSAILGIRSIDSCLIKAKPYKENSLTMQNKMGIVVLRIPKTEELDAIKDTSYNKFLETKKIVKEKATSKEELYSGFNILNFVEEPSLASTNNPIDIEDQYLDYIVSLKYEGIITNYKNLKPHFILTNTHKTLINQLLQIDYNNPKILYVFYRNINTAADNTSVKNQLYLTSYLNVIRAYIYSKNLKSVFMQEVQIKDFPVNEILLVVKPISFEEYRKLPKQINVYNAPKISSKAWLEEINLLERKAKEKHKKLYD